MAVLLALTLGCARERRDTDRDVIGRNYPRVDGSVSTQPLSVLTACKIREVPYEWRRPQGAEREIFVSPKNRVLGSKIEKGAQHRGTHQAYEALMQRKADLILVIREPSRSELEAARSAGVEFDIAPIAFGALVFLLNADNPVDNLTLDQVRDIYGPAAMKSWAAAGGRDEAIAPFRLEPESDSEELMDKLVMKELPVRDVREVGRLYTMQRVIDTIAARQTGIAYSIYYYVTNMAENKRVKTIEIEGVKPTRGTIGAKSYPLSTQVFAVIRKGTPREDPAALLRTWLLSNAGQTAVQESGYIPVTQP